MHLIPARAPASRARRGVGVSAAFLRGGDGVRGVGDAAVAGRSEMRALLLGAAALLTAVLALGMSAWPVGAAGNVSAVTGSAYGFRAYGIAIFGGAQHETGPTPAVTIASNASNSPQAASAGTGVAQYGPATLFTSDGISVQTSASLGATGSVTSSSTVRDINKATTQSSTGSEPLTASTMSATCTASTTGATGSTTISGGTLQTDSGLDLNGDGDYVDAGEHAPVKVGLPGNPGPNTSISGHIHVGSTSTDSFHYVFNEHVTSGGTLTVNAVHEYFDGPTLTGNLIIGQVVCGATVSAASSTSSRTLVPSSTSRSTTKSSSATAAPTPAASPSASTTSTDSTDTTETTDTFTDSTTTGRTSTATAVAATGGGGRMSPGVVAAIVAGGLLLTGVPAAWWGWFRRRRA